MPLRSVSAKKIVLVAIFTSALLPSAALSDNFHPGRVIERGSSAPVSSDVKAWEPQQRTDQSSCPEYGSSPVDTQISDGSTGEFGLKIPTDVRSYHVVYCANGYHNRVDRHIPNDSDGSPVIPIPAQLRAQSETAAVDGDTVRLAVFALNELAYLFEVNPEGFKAALSEYSGVVGARDSGAGEVLGSLPDLIAQWAFSQ